jgi:tetratricopeptide (TPR) repeat protein
MSPRVRVTVVAAVAAAAAAGGVVAIVLAQTKDERAAQAAAKPRKGAPPLAFDFGLRADATATTLARAQRDYNAGRRDAACAVFRASDALEGRIGAAFCDWRHDGLARITQLATENPRSPVVRLHLGFAELWAGRSVEALAAWRKTLVLGADTPYAVSAGDLLHPNSPRGLPIFVPSVPVPARLQVSDPRRQLALLARARDVHGTLLYGVFLQRLGRRVSAERAFAAAARLAPADPDAQVAAAVGRFTKERPVDAFSRLGPLSRRFPRAPTVRFHLGLLLIWSGDLRDGGRQLRLARAEGPKTLIGWEATGFLAALARSGTK